MIHKRLACAHKIYFLTIPTKTGSHFVSLQLLGGENSTAIHHLASQSECTKSTIGGFYMARDEIESTQQTNSRIWHMIDFERVKKTLQRFRAVLFIIHEIFGEMSPPN